MAIIGSQTLWALGFCGPERLHLPHAQLRLGGGDLGGLLFGYGMVLGNGCGAKTLVRLGAGNLKSLVRLLVIAVTAYMTLHGLLALGRVRLETHNLTLPVSQGLGRTAGGPDRAFPRPAALDAGLWPRRVAGPVVFEGRGLPRFAQSLAFRADRGSADPGGLVHHRCSRQATTSTRRRQPRSPSSPPWAIPSAT